MTSLAPEVIESLDTFEAVADAARMVSADMDSGRWTLGDLANQCARKWGENTIGDLAAEIRIAKAQTLRDYARVARRFPFALRNAFEDAPLTFSHFRTACAAGDRAELWLARAADDGLTVAALARAIKEATGKPVPPRKLWEGECICYADDYGDLFMRLVDEAAMQALPPRFVVRIYEAEAADV